MEVEYILRGKSRLRSSLTMRRNSVVTRRFTSAAILAPRRSASRINSRALVEKTHPAGFIGLEEHARCLGRLLGRELVLHTIPRRESLSRVVSGMECTQACFLLQAQLVAPLFVVFWLAVNQYPAVGCNLAVFAEGHRVAPQAFFGFTKYGPASRFGWP